MIKTYIFEEYSYDPMEVHELIVNKINEFIDTHNIDKKDIVSYETKYFKTCNKYYYNVEMVVNSQQIIHKDIRSVYSVMDISEMLSINPETVRRWIRSGKLKAKQSSRKDGNLILKIDLDKFLSEKGINPKYEK